MSLGRDTQTDLGKWGMDGMGGTKTRSGDVRFGGNILPSLQQNLRPGAPEKQLDELSDLQIVQSIHGKPGFLSELTEYAIANPDSRQRTMRVCEGAITLAPSEEHRVAAQGTIDAVRAVEMLEVLAGA